MKDTRANEEGILDEGRKWGTYRGRGVERALDRAGLQTGDVMGRSWGGDWGTLSPEQVQKNDASFKTDCPQIVSCFVTSLGDEYRELERKGDVSVGPPCS